MNARCCRAGDGGSLGCSCAKPNVLVWWFWIVELAVLALTRKVMIIMLFDSSIWCGKHPATLLHPNKCLFVGFPSLSSPCTSSPHQLPAFGKLVLTGMWNLCPALTALQVEANNFFASSRSRLVMICWLRKCVLWVLITQKLSSGQKGSQAVVRSFLAAALTACLPA